MRETEALEQLFSYGTLQDEAVQVATFGCMLEGAPDALSGYCQAQVEILDPHVVAATGAPYYLNAEYTGRDPDVVEGTRFWVTRAELLQADAYEASADYHRIRVHLRSGIVAWVYVSAQ